MSNPRDFEVVLGLLQVIGEAVKHGPVYQPIAAEADRSLKEFMKEIEKDRQARAEADAKVQAEANAKREAEIQAEAEERLKVESQAKVDELAAEARAKAEAAVRAELASRPKVEPTATIQPQPDPGFRRPVVNPEPLPQEGIHE